MPTITDAPVHARTLRLLLRLNAAFSALTGVIAVALANQIARAIEIDAVWIVRAIGFGLVLNAIDLLVVAALRPSLLVPFSRVTSAADAAWVLGTVAIVATGAVGDEGAVLLTLVVVPVAALAIAQWRTAARSS